MSDTTLNAFVASGTAAERAAFTPTPPTPSSGPDSGYFFFETDTGLTYSWNGAIWVQTGGGGANSVTAAGTLTSGSLVIGQGTKTVAVTTTGTGIVTALGVNVGSAGAPVLFNGALGTPSSGTLTSVTGLPLTTGVTGTLPIANGGTGITNSVGFHLATVTVNNANTLTLPTAAFQLVAAPGAGFANVLISSQLIANTVAAAYTNINAAGFGYIQYNGGYVYSNLVGNDATLTPARAYLTALLGTTTKEQAQFVPFTDTVQTSQWGNMVVPFNVTASENKALEFFINNNGGGNLTGGNAANSLTFYTVYQTVAIP